MGLAKSTAKYQDMVLLILSVIFNLPMSFAESSGIAFYRSPQSSFASGQMSKPSLESRLLRTEEEKNYGVEWNSKRYVLLANQITWGLDFPGPHSFQTVINTPIRKDASFQSSVVDIVPPQRFVIAQSFEKSGWIKVRFKDAVGFVRLEQVIGQCDFAQEAFLPKKGWLKIHHREGSFLIDADDRKHMINEFSHFKVNSQKGILVRESAGDSPPLLARLAKKEEHKAFWKISFLQGHGMVWWKDKESPLVQSETFTREELLKRKVYSYAVENKTGQGLISAQGIYKSVDGKIWKKVPEFKDEDHPVFLSSNKDWFIGNYRIKPSTNELEPYLRWDLVVQKYLRAHESAPRSFRLQKIEESDHGFLKLSFDVNGSHWQTEVLPLKPASFDRKRSAEISTSRRDPRLAKYEDSIQIFR